MILRRLGNKSRIAKDIIKYFPKHSIYIEYFFGAGGMYFNKPKAKYNFLNDLDSNVYNCFDVLMRYKQELKDYIEMMPYHKDFWNECKTRTPENNIEKAVYFLFLSNCGFMGMPDNLHYSRTNSKNILLQNIEKTYLDLVKNDKKFLNTDFRNVLKSIAFRTETEKLDAFIYSDPPYLETENNYDIKEKWTEKDVIDCFDYTFDKGIRAAMSEFNHPFIIEQAEKRNLNIITIGERHNLKNRNTEILITNYDTKQLTLF